jgi:hypothetical protein
MNSSRNSMMVVCAVIGMLLVHDDELASGQDVVGDHAVGDVVASLLPLDAFSQNHAGTWMPLDGSPLVGTRLAAISGLEHTPDASSHGGATLRMSSGGRLLGDVQGPQLAAHTHLYEKYGLTLRDASREGENGRGRMRDAMRRAIARGGPAPIVLNDRDWPRGGLGASSSPVIGLPAYSPTQSSSVGEGETRMANVAVMFYVRVQ